jgi:S1-C subfamily serine protease
VQPIAAGSGVVISNDGLILTNAHVVDLTDPQTGRTITNAVVSVKTPDGKLRTAKVLGTSPGNDIALVKVDDTSGLTPVPLGDSDALQVGDPVLAIGNALDLGDTPTVTSGIISAKDRTLQVDANVTLYGLLQTDAAINHGNSGGALVNGRGELVGVPSAGIPNTNNVGFAIAINKVKPLLDQLKQGGTVTTTVAVLGVTTVENVQGVTVTGVSQGSGAEKAGIQVGDIITAVDGKAVSGQDSLGAAIKAHKPGDTIQVGVARNGQAVTVTATLGSRQQ